MAPAIVELALGGFVFLWCYRTQETSRSMYGDRVEINRARLSPNPKRHRPEVPVAVARDFGPVPVSHEPPVQLERSRERPPSIWGRTSVIVEISRPHLCHRYSRGIPTLRPADGSYTHLFWLSSKFASYIRETGETSAAELLPSTPIHHKPVPPLPSAAMIISAKRKVLDGLNRRYIYGRVVCLLSPSNCLCVLFPLAPTDYSATDSHFCTRSYSSSRWRLLRGLRLNLTVTMPRSQVRCQPAKPEETLDRMLTKL